MEQEALDHAIRCWHAEETNAERIANRKTLIVGIPAGFLAIVGLHAQEIAKLLVAVYGPAFDSPGPVSEPWSIVCLALLVLGLVGLFSSFAFAIGVRPSDPEHAELASKSLHLMREWQISELLRAHSDAAREISFMRTSDAARRLHRMNEDVESRLFWSTSWGFGGALLCFLAFLIYPFAVR